MVQRLTQQNDQLVLEQPRNAQELENFQRILNDKDALLQEANQRLISLERSVNSTDALLHGAIQKAASLQRSLNDKDARLQEAIQRVASLQQSLNDKDAELREANRRAGNLQIEVERQQKDTQSLQQDVRDMRFLLSDADARIAEGSQGIQESEVLRIDSCDIHFTDNKLGHGSYGGLVIPLTTLSHS